jgi:hypothetical protein
MFFGYSAPESPVDPIHASNHSITTLQERYYTALQPDFKQHPHADETGARPSLSFSIRSAFSFRSMVNRPQSAASGLPEADSGMRRMTKAFRKFVKRGH